jgi:hypothetical protein
VEEKLAKTGGILGVSSAQVKVWKTAWEWESFYADGGQLGIGSALPVK